jgi:hypothetical protein
MGIPATASLWIYMVWIMINIDQLLHCLTHCWYPHMCFFGHFDSIPHQSWQMMASGSNRNKQQQDSGGHCSNGLFVNTQFGLRSILTGYYTVWHTAGAHSCASSVTLIQFLTSDKPWPLGQIGTSYSTTVMGIPATAFLWIHGMDYDQYRSATTLFDTLLVPIHVLLQSLWFNSSPVTNHGLWVK